MVRLEVCLLAEAAHAFLELSGFKASLLLPNFPLSASPYVLSWYRRRQADLAEQSQLRSACGRAYEEEEFVDDPAILGNIDHEIKLAREWIAEMDDEPKEDRPARTSTTLTSKTISDRRTLNLAASAGVLVFAGQSDAWRDAAKIFLPMPVQPKPV